MTTITASDVVAVAPELASFADTVDGAAAIARSIATALIDVSEEVWGLKYARGLALYAAHLTLADNATTLGGLVSGGGVLQSISVGQASESYATSSSTLAMGPHGFTRPGMMYDTESSTLQPAFFYY